MTTLRTRESLCLDLDDCYKEIADLKLANKKLTTVLAEIAITARNRKHRMHELQAENDQLRNRRD